MKTSPGFSEESLMKVFKIICAEKRTTAKKISQKTGMSSVTAYRILRCLTDKGFLTQSTREKTKGRGRSPLLYVISSKASILIYDLRDNDVIIFLHTLKTGKSKKLLFKYKNKRNSESKLDFFISTQKTLINRTASKKIILGAVYIIDGLYDKENDKIVSRSFKELSGHTFSEIKGVTENSYIIDYGEFLSDYLESFLDGKRSLFVDFSPQRKNAYIFEDGNFSLSANIDEIQKMPLFNNFSINDIKYREENIGNILNLFCRIFKPETVCVSSPYIDNYTCFKIREKFDLEKAEYGLSGDDIIFIDSSVFNCETAAVSYIMKRLPASALK